MFISPSTDWVFTTLRRSSSTSFILKTYKYGSDVMNKVDRLVDYFNKNYIKDISIGQDVDNRIISKNRFIHCFKEVMKVTPMSYFVQLRISV